MGKINREWHEQNRMPKNATLEQRISWHIEHSKHCTCRLIPPSVLEALAQQGKQLPTDP
jgi:hypothetical protein